MDWERLAPWNWFKKEEEEQKSVPVKFNQDTAQLSSPLVEIHREFDRLFDKMNKSLMSSSLSNEIFDKDFFKPLLDVSSDQNSYIIDVELPGMEAEDISIKLEDRTLRIKGEKKQETKESDKGYYRVERSYGSFQRTLDLPNDADESNISSTYSNGVLKIDIPKKSLPKSDTKQIEIKKV